MGLDIRALRKLQPITETEYDTRVEQGDHESVVRVFALRGLEARLGSLAEGTYKGEALRFEPFASFRAGSYSGYGKWRDWLARAGGWYGVSDPTEDEAETPCAAAVWRARGVGNFGELIDFSDCDGCIGPEVAWKLARDFQAHEATARAIAITEGDLSLYERDYRNFWKAFEWAADGGAVILC